MEIHTTPYHKRRKKGARRRLDRRKTHTQINSDFNKENEPPPSQSTPTLPSHWQSHGTGDTTQYIKIDDMRDDEMCQVSSSIVVHQDGTWVVFFRGQRVPSSNALLAKVPQCITSASPLQSLFLAVDNAVFCPGNPDDKFVSVCRGRKEEKMCGDRGFGQTIGFIDHKNSHRKNL